MRNISKIYWEYDSCSSNQMKYHMISQAILMDVRIHGDAMAWKRPSAILCVPKLKSILCVIFHAIDGAVCIQLTHFSCDDCKNTCTLFHHHWQIGSMHHLLLFVLGHERLVCTLCLSMTLFCISIFIQIVLLHSMFPLLSTHIGELKTVHLPQISSNAFSLIKLFPLI